MKISCRLRVTKLSMDTLFWVLVCVSYINMLLHIWMCLFWGVHLCAYITGKCKLIKWYLQGYNCCWCLYSSQTDRLSSRPDSYEMSPCKYYLLFSNTITTWSLLRPDEHSSLPAHSVTIGACATRALTVRPLSICPIATSPHTPD
jgi:hypothetical protein